jgi:hypothetical protein
VIAAFECPVWLERMRGQRHQRLLSVERSTVRVAHGDQKVYLARRGHAGLRLRAEDGRRGEDLGDGSRLASGGFGAEHHLGARQLLR